MADVGEFASSRDRPITLFYGESQVFRRRGEDINIVGTTSLALPVRKATFWLNGGPPSHFYVERRPAAGENPRYPWGTHTPAVNRLRDLPGHFNIEIPVDHEHLRAGHNALCIAVEGADGGHAELQTAFSWDPEPVTLPLHLSDLSQAPTVQHVGQPVDGLWDIDREGHAITARAPVGHDALLLLGGPHRSQEATYQVVFSSPMEGVFIGLSDFFVRHDAQWFGLGIKPGYSTAGLATVTADGFSECWLAMGDNTWDKTWPWVKKSAPAFTGLASGVAYAVRHQVIFDRGVLLSRFRIWPAANPEPVRWLCSAHTGTLSPELPRPDAASFGLFQYHGQPTRWSNIEVHALQVTLTEADLAESHFLTDAFKKARFRAVRLAQRARSKVSVWLRGDRNCMNHRPQSGNNGAYS